MGELGISLGDPDDWALDILGDILNSFGGRLFDRIRSREVWHILCDLPCCAGACIGSSRNDQKDHQWCLCLNLIHISRPLPQCC